MRSSVSQPRLPGTFRFAAAHRLTLIVAVLLFVSIGASAFVFVRTHATVNVAAIEQQETLIVDNTTDNSVLQACTAAPNDCSLRGAIIKANVSASDDVIAFDTAVFSTLQTIVINDPNQEPLRIVSNSHVTINGGGKVKLSGNIQRRVLEINSGAVVALNGLIIADGRDSFNGGGGIRNNAGTVTLTNSTVTGNITGGSVGGAGIFNDGGTFNVNNSIVSGNSSAGTGGGILNNAGTVNVSDSTVTGNSVNCLPGGGISNNGTLNVTDSIISGNSVVSCNGGGGIYNNNGSIANVTNSTVSGNSGISTAGGIQNQGVFSLTNSTVSGNSAGSVGGILNTFGSTLNLKNTTVSRNAATTGSSGGIQTSGPVNSRNSIIAGNTASSVNPDFSGTLTSQGYNLIGNTTGTTITGDTTGNILNQSAQLAPLGNYGGGTLTHALLSTSPAINAGTSTDALATDQRGANRVGQTDIGAFEVNALYRNVLSVGDVGISYAQTIVSNKLDFTYSVTSGSLPPGLTFDAATATVSTSGVPTTGGTFNFDITAERSGATSTTSYSIVINGAPAISNIADHSTNEDTPTGDITFAVGDAETAAGSLIVSATSDNQTLVPNANITLGGTDGDRTINVNPALNQFGSALITVTVADARNLKATDTFVLTVDPVNDPPTISTIASTSTNEDTPSGNINFSVSDVETAAESLTVSATSDNQTLIPDANISLGGSGSNRTISLNPALNQFGTATIKVVVSDGVATAESTFVFTVNSVNDAPSISDISSTSTNEDTATGNISFTVGDVETAAGSLTVSATSDNQTLVPNANIALSGSGANRTINITPALNEVGSALITVTVTDEGNLTATDTFTLTVNAVNDAPTISDIANTSTNEDTPSGNINFTIGDPDGPDVPLTVSATSDNQVLVPNANISLGGSGSTRTINLTPAPNQFGSALITVTVTDSENLTATDTFTLTVNSVNDAPTISDIANQTFTYNGPTSAISFTVDDVESAPNDLTVTGSSSNTTLVPSGNIVFGGQGASRTVTVTPAADQSGTTTITITVSDGSLPAQDTFLLTFTNTAPTISDIANISATEDAATTGDINFTVGDVETAAGSLTVSATSDNQTLVPDSNITLGGSGASRTISLAPALNRSGTATITVVVSDGNATGQDTFVLTVTPVNDVFVVDTTSDDGTLSACTTAPNDCSLRGATKSASNDVVEFDSTVFATLQTITLSGTQLTIENGGGTLTINGGGKVRVNAGNQSRVFQINSGVTATFNGLIITGGRSNSRGGGINNYGVLNLTASTITGNTATGDFLIGGGGIANNGGTLTVTGSTVSGNSTTASGSGGGGISQEGGTVSVINSTISGNTSFEYGGGLVKSGGTANITNSTISTNNGRFFGGGIFQSNGTVNLTNSTIAGNSSSQGGGVRNASGSVNTRNTIIAGNTASAFGPDVYGFLASQGYNLIGNTQQTTLLGNSTGNILNQNAQLAPLQNNGGTTLTHALLSNSPALNAGSNALALDLSNQPLMTDQRGAGFPRIFGGTVDMGAIESGGQSITVTTSAPANATYGTTFTVAATSGSGLPVTYSSAGVCTNVGATFTINSGTGTCSVKYDQAGDNEHSPAAQVTETVNAEKASQNISVSNNAPANASYNTSFTVAASATSGLPVSFSSAGSCSNSGASFTMNAATGSCSVKYDQGGDSNYSAASQVIQTVSAQKADQTITFGALAGKTFGAANFDVGATASSGLGVSFVAAGNCTLAGNTVHITAAGSCTITASQSGDSNFNAAASVPQSFTIDKATSVTTVTCPANVSYTGSALTPCTASVTGVGGLTESVTVDYTNNTNAGVANASASFAGDTNHASSSDAKTFTIDKATSTTTVTCPANMSYTGSALTPCTASVTGAGGLSQSVSIDYTNNTNAGTANASASYAGDANHASSSDAKTFTIDKATSTTTVTCPVNVSYTGSALTPCTASVTGVGGLSQAVTVDYTNNTNAGTANASASFAGDMNHASSSDAKTFAIDKATSTTIVTCPANMSYTGSALTPCTASVTGVGGLSQAVTVDYTNNTNAGTANASASFAGDMNHASSSDAKTFAIDKATSTTIVTCPANMSYTGSALTPCTASVTGVGGLSQSVTVDYTSNTNAGTGNASASFAGDANHASSSDAKTFTIDKATSTTTVTCPANVSYTGTALTPCTASVTGAGGLSQSVTVDYTNNTNAGTANASASFAGDANHASSSDAKIFTIDKATSVMSVTCPANVSYTGSALTPCTASVTGVGGLSQAVTVDYTNNTNAGTANASASFTGDANHASSSDTRTFTVDKATSTTTVTCPANVSYTGTALTPCTASVTGAGGLSHSLTVDYANNTNAGTANVSATFAGDANHASSNDFKTFTIDKSNQTITFDALPNKTFGDANFAVSATSSSSLAVSFSTVGPCVVTGNSVHLTGSGTCTITAAQTGNSNYNAAASVSQSFNIAKATSTTTLASSANPSDLGQSVTFIAKVNSNAGTPSGTVQFKVDGVNAGPPATLNGSGLATLSTSSLTSGTRIITADYSGDTNFLTSSGTLSGGQVVNGQPSLSINDASIVEGNSGTKTLNFTVTLSGTSSLVVTVNYATANGTATAPSDFTAVATNSLTFAPGDLTKTVSVTINGDTDFESDETLFVNLSSPVNATISDGQGVGTITNDDAQGGNIKFSAENYDVSEGTGFVTLTVNRSGDTSSPVTVDYATDDTGAAANCGILNSGLASARCDFTAAFGTLSFAANETQKTITIPINQDSFTEGPEVFRISLANPTGGAVLTTPSSPAITVSDSVAPALNAIDDTTTFVRQQYHDFLNREPDPAGLAFWVDNIEKCHDPARLPPDQTVAQCIQVQRINTSAAFFLSIEFLESGGMVRDFYVATLNRTLINNMPNFGEFIRDTQSVQRGIVVGRPGWEAALAANRSAFMNDFVMRTEFVGLYPTTDAPTQYVDKVTAHAAITLTSAERSAAIGEFGVATAAADPGARGRALLRVTQNATFQARELNRAFVHMQYLGYLRRDPNAAPDTNFDGYNFWLDKLIHFNGNYINAEMVKAFISSAEYRSRFGP